MINIFVPVTPLLFKNNKLLWSSFNLKIFSSIKFQEMLLRPLVNISFQMCYKRLLFEGKPVQIIFTTRWCTFQFTVIQELPKPQPCFQGLPSSHPLSHSRGWKKRDRENEVAKPHEKIYILCLSNNNNNNNNNNL